ncbi:hypothetical protein O3G_MSEX001949 [Manduca sexta]|uniref:Nonsense-mediated mRNA decay factor SMG8 n=1 Tax=Manduca sexta TaxID=7130 RepID=A0A921YLX8_MANSE|nr:hypothetical protein O3G_MSEX001949 [Manduca sexta]
MQVFSISDIPNFSKKERIVVVGVIGKSPYRYPNKTTPLLSTVQSENTDIECHWDERRGVLYLHAVTHMDTKLLAELAENLSEKSKSTVKDADASHWLVASGELAIDSCKLIALLFQLCHIVVLSSPTSVFDIGYLQLLKAIDSYRAELSMDALSALTGAGAGGAWETHSRCCCPRLLFHFRRAPAPLKKAPAALKRLEHSVEDQLYFIFRKARIITNVCAKSLFAIPKNEEFVYISTDDEVGNARDVSQLVRGLVRLCAGAPVAAAKTERPGFAQFVQAHVDLAFAEGFDDNVGKYAMSTSFFELPSASSWRVAAKALLKLYTRVRKVPEGAEPSGALFDALATDVRFSQARCAKVLPIAQASYAEGLPAHYSNQHHLHKVSLALGVLETMARGALAGGARARLAAACAHTYAARRLCEAPSLTGHPCALPLHDSGTEHSSGVCYVSACNCGRTKVSREDPYSARAANCAFYAAAAQRCQACPTLLTIDFPVFQPSTPTYKAAAVKGASSEEPNETVVGRQSELSSLSGGSAGSAASAAEGSAAGAWSGPHALSPGSAGSHASNDDDDAGYLVPLRGDAATEKVISRQPSTTEYLPGMLHTASPAGLLPAFPSWSLVCVGASSLYSHSVGLPEHLQPGFLPHTNFLMPWDCAVR